MAVVNNPPTTSAMEPPSSTSFKTEGGRGIKREREIFVDWANLERRELTIVPMKSDMDIGTCIVFTVSEIRGRANVYFEWVVISDPDEKDENGGIRRSTEVARLKATKIGEGQVGVAVSPASAEWSSWIDGKVFQLNYGDRWSVVKVDGY